MDSFRFPLRGSNKRGARIGTTPDRPSTIDFLFGIPPLLISFELYSLSLFLFFFASFLERRNRDIFPFFHAYFTLYFSYSRVRIYKRERGSLLPFSLGGQNSVFHRKHNLISFFPHSNFLRILCISIFSLNRVGIVKENIDRRAIGGDIDRGGREFTFTWRDVRRRRGKSERTESTSGVFEKCCVHMHMHV